MRGLLVSGSTTSILRLSAAPFSKADRVRSGSAAFQTPNQANRATTVATGFGKGVWPRPTQPQNYLLKSPKMTVESRQLEFTEKVIYRVRCQLKTNFYDA